ncbi:MAG: histidine kinase dimerization/phosphoacceptor domain -containing protein [Ginsengibacter sp.]
MILLLFVCDANAQFEKDTNTVNTLLKSSQDFISKTGRLQSDLNAALSLANKAENISIKAGYKQGEGNSNVVTADAYNEMNNHAAARPYASKAVDILNKYGNDIEKAKAYISLGGTYDDNDSDFQEKIKLYEQGIAAFHKAGDKISEAQIMQFTADLYYNQNQYAKSLQLLQQALVIYQSIGYKQLQGLYNLMGAVYNSKNDYTQSLYYNLLAAKTGEQLKDTGRLMCTIYDRLALNYLNISYYQQALTYFNQALIISKKYFDTASIILIRQNMSEVSRRMGNYDKALEFLSETQARYASKDLSLALRGDIIFETLYVWLHKKKEADRYYQKLLAWYNSALPDSAYRPVICLVIGDYLEANGRFNETYNYLDVFSKEVKNKPPMPTRLVHFESLYYKADSATGNYIGALQHFGKYKAISDSASNMDKTKQFDQLRLQYETEKKDKDIQLLTQQNQIQDTTISQQKSTKNIIIGGASALLLLLIISYRAYRQKQKNNLRLKVKQDEINQQNELLKKLVSDREWLLKEIHHRVKNNLQIVISLLNTQSAYLDNEDALRAIKNSQHRMHAMSLIHQRLYQSDNLSCIDMHWYVQELAAYMRESYASDKKIQFILNIEKIELDVVQAVPLGLILNEAISNAIKYAFPNNKPGEIAITLKRLKDNNCSLTITDNGIGLPNGFDVQNSESLGMSLLYGLSEQLGGALEVSNNNGLSLQVGFIINDELDSAKQSLI